MDQTSRLQLARIIADPAVPETADAVPALRQAINDHANKLDTAGIFIHGAAGSRPAAGVVDRYYLADDTGELTRDTGTTWQTIKTAADSASVLAAVALLLPIGTRLPYGGTSDPGDIGGGITFMLADGRLIDRTAGAGLAFFGVVGHKYNGGIDPGGTPLKVKLPDQRGRVLVGSDNMGTTQGAAGRLPNSNRAAGQNGGEERHLLTGAESGVKAHAHSASQTTHHHGFAGGATVLNAGGGYNAFSPGSGVAVGTTTQTDDQTPTVTVNNATAVNADTAHNVMQPYDVDNVIVRVA